MDKDVPLSQEVTLALFQLKRTIVEEVLNAFRCD